MTALQVASGSEDPFGDAIWAKSWPQASRHVVSSTAVSKELTPFELILQI